MAKESCEKAYEDEIVATMEVEGTTVIENVTDRLLWGTIFCITSTVTIGQYSDPLVAPSANSQLQGQPHNISRQKAYASGTRNAMAPAPASSAAGASSASMGTQGRTRAQQGAARGQPEMSDSELAAKLHREMNSSRRVSAARAAAAVTATLHSTSTAATTPTTSSHRHDLTAPSSSSTGNDERDCDSERNAVEDDSGSESSGAPRVPGRRIYRKLDTTPDAKPDTPANTNTCSIPQKPSRTTSEDSSEQHTKGESEQLEAVTRGKSEENSIRSGKNPADGNTAANLLLLGNYKVDKSGRPTTTAGRLALKRLRESHAASNTSSQNASPLSTPTHIHRELVTCESRQADTVSSALVAPERAGKVADAADLESPKSTSSHHRKGGSAAAKWQRLASEVSAVPRNNGTESKPTGPVLGRFPELLPQKLIAIAAHFSLPESYFQDSDLRPSVSNTWRPAEGSRAQPSRAQPSRSKPSRLLSSTSLTPYLPSF
ncbi:hypothetical protein CYMTET_37082 [Cymbomonas tetramitiformis]|uniref:Uncharacterized protein n=1 Tax=Cymbomonas tetramitiformis TaxID=36881 RepID=A0AAE0CER4_9CHLO|nr:hypothetical protein CYMTET_37082 [Cymbomonas tetramitiformis]